ncbi:MAG: pyrroloquinoline quinone-dependent dehydrogenase [Acidobacteria bacterium]|nr:pyrroloquinoline quinone-dependent dehydrogenase [Acidobacteriota bacterium]
MEKRGIEVSSAMKALGCAVAVAAAAVFFAQQQTAVKSDPGAVREPSVAESAQTVGWRFTEGSAGGGRYSPLADINRDNVKQLKVAWSYRHGDVRDASGPDRVHRGTAFEATPIMVEGRLIFSTPFNRVIALDPETGAELWTFDPKIDRSRRFANMMISRGVAYWRDAKKGNARIFLGTLDARLIALDVKTGRPCADFGNGGTVNLLEDIEQMSDPWEYNVTSPPTVVGDNVIVGSSIADITRRIQPSGAVRAYDACTGKLVWRFNTIPKADEFGNDTWERDSWKQTGGANVWSTITADVRRGMVFLPVSSVSSDFYGGDRPGANLFSDSIVALNAKTGKYVWHFQTVHHDLWDYDLAAPPNLVRVRHHGREIDAVAQATKTGFVFLLDCETGKPLFPVEEKQVPQSDVTYEKAWPTQPFPVKPAPLVPQHLAEADLWDFDQKRFAKCREKLRRLRNEGIFTPPSERGSIIYPFTAGGANWSGGAFDPASGMLYVPVNNLAHTIQLKKLPDSNFNNTDGKVMHTGLAGLWWLMTGKGTGLRFLMDRKLFAENDVPCNRPPWGWLVAVDLNRGEIIWREPVGEDRKMGVRGLNNFGPPLATAGGLVFHAGSRDLRLRAHDAQTGETLAQFDLPAGLHAGPITYKLAPGRKQFLVIAPGGHIGLGSKLGDYIIAFTLPDRIVSEVPP